VNTHELNTSALNGGDVVNNSANIGPAASGFTFYLYEIDGTPMAGATGIATAVLADLTRVIQIPNAAAQFIFGASADLAQLRTILLSNGTTGISFAASANINNAVFLPSAASDITFSASGALYAKLTMAGSTGIAFNAYSPAGPQKTQLMSAAPLTVSFSVLGDLAQIAVMPIGAASTGISFSANATLTNYTHMGDGLAGITLTASGSLARYVFMPSAGSGVEFDVFGALFNNPQTVDPQQYTVVRPFVDRTMVTGMGILGKFEKQPREAEWYAFKMGEDMAKSDEITEGYCALRYGTKPVVEVTLTGSYAATLADNGILIYTTASVALPGGAPLDYRLMVANIDQDSAITVGSFSVAARGALIVRMTAAGWAVELAADLVIVAAGRDQRLRVRVTGGARKTRYMVQATATTAEGRIMEDELELKIKED
jgi:hypothetical protein